ncbi:MAG: type II secretion system protein GspD [Gemmatimonadaceae bacterium]
MVNAFNPRRPSIAMALLVVAMLSPATASAQQDSLVIARGDSVSIRLVDVDLRAAVQALSRYMDRPVVFSGVAGSRVTLETPRPVRRADVPRLLKGLLESQNVDLVEDSASGIYRLRNREMNRAPVPASAPSSVAPGSQVPLLYVIHLRHAKATEVAATVNALYGRASAFGEVGDRMAPMLSRDLNQMQAPPVAVAPQAVASVAGRVASLTGETTIVPDARANSLLIRASAPDFALIQAAVTELDVRPLQVLIEVLIAEVRRDRSLDFGVDATLPRSRVHGTTSTTVEATNTSEGLGDLVIKVMSLGNLNIGATIHAAASRGDVNIVSRPVLLAANNERAEINVGSQRPFVQVSRVLPTDNTARDQVVQYKDVGTKLQIVPTISADGYVMLQVSQEINAATAEQQFNAPIISTRAVQTRLLVKDGQTIVLGGLIDRQKEVTATGIPFLSAIPWVGGFFGHAARHQGETELFLFLTPRVIRQDADVEEATKTYEKQAPRVKP